MLKKHPGFYLLLIVKYERKEINGRKNGYANRNQDLVIGEVLSLYRLQKVLKLGHSMLGKYALQGRPRV